MMSRVFAGHLRASALVGLLLDPPHHTTTPKQSSSPALDNTSGSSDNLRLGEVGLSVWAKTKRSEAA